MIQRALALAEEETPVEDRERSPESGIALCLSGGGYRAMLFHLGSLWRLNEFGYLPKLDRISSVSGGSITAAALGLKWASLAFSNGDVAGNFDAEVVAPIRRLAGKTIDVWSVLGGLFGPGSVGLKIAKRYDEHLYRGATLQDLPDRPRFVINATNVQSGVLWRFSKPYVWDWRVGKVEQPATPLAQAVAASSAFPPVLSPTRFEFPSGTFKPGTGEDLQRRPFTSDVILTDGGIYDNLGLETAWKRYTTILVSDGGGKLAPEGKPKRDWARHSYRILTVIDNQVRSLRKRHLIDSYVGGEREGAYWGIRTNINHYGLADNLLAPHDKTLAIAETPTRLKKLSDDTQERLINWGYAVADAAMRRHVDQSLTPPTRFPYPDAGVG